MFAVMALSGGMDSTSLLLNLLAREMNVTCLSFDYGQKHNVELERASSLIEYLGSHSIKVEHQIIDLRSATALFRVTCLPPVAKFPKDIMKKKV